MRHRIFVLVLMLISCALAGNPLSLRAAEPLPLDQRAALVPPGPVRHVHPLGRLLGDRQGASGSRTRARSRWRSTTSSTRSSTRSQFDAAEWVGLAKRAGQKYIVITTKHHDGFCMFDSKLTDYDIMQHAVQARRDARNWPTSATGRACSLGFYYSIMDWHHPDYTPRRPWEKDRSTEGADFDRYVEYMRGQIRELMTNYGEIDVLWFDGGWERKAPEDLQEVPATSSPWPGSSSRTCWSTTGPTSPATSRRPSSSSPPRAWSTSKGRPAMWEVCMTMTTGHGSFAPTAWWGYDRNETVFKPTDELIQKLVDMASKGGNLLLNVGPTPEGVIRPEESRAPGRRSAAGWTGTARRSTARTASPFRLLPFFGRVTQQGQPAVSCTCSTGRRIAGWSCRA